MPVTKADLAKRIGGTATAEAVADQFDLAVELLDGKLVDAFRPMPDKTYKECVLSIGYALWDRQKSSSGTRQQTTMEGQVPVRSPRDPLASVRTILADYVLGFA